MMKRRCSESACTLILKMTSLLGMKTEFAFDNIITQSVCKTSYKVIR